MTEVIVQDVIDAPVEDVWTLVGDFGGVARWSPVEDVRVEGEGVGAVRELSLPGGDLTPLRERLESYDPEAKRLSYSIIEPAPLPLRHYLSTLSLSERNGRCAIDWRGRFEPDGVDEERAKEMVRRVYGSGIEALKKHFG